MLGRWCWNSPAEPPPPWPPRLPGTHTAFPGSTQDGHRRHQQNLLEMGVPGPGPQGQALCRLQLMHLPGGRGGHVGNPRGHSFCQTSRWARASEKRVQIQGREFAFSTGSPRPAPSLQAPVLGASRNGPPPSAPQTSEHLLGLHTVLAGRVRAHSPTGPSHRGAGRGQRGGQGGAQGRGQGGGQG